jgi:hypothetical protein
VARARNIKPGFYRDAALVELPIETRLLFPGLWVLADRAGRLEDRPKQIKMEIYPADNFDVDLLLNQLQGAGLIERYEIDGRKLIQIKNFSKHQNPHRDEKASTIPAPCEHCVSMMQEPDCYEANRADSLIPDSSTTGQKPLAQPSACASLFSRFWQAYPKKRSKGDAEKAWKAIKPDEHLLAIMLAAVQRAKTREDWIKDGGEFIPYPASWLRAKGWEDGETVVALPVQKPEELCACCGVRASKRIGQRWFCAAHDQYSEKAAA